MKITFFYARAEHIGIEYLSAVLKEKGYQTDLVFSPLRKKSEDSLLKKMCFLTDYEMAQEIINTNPDIAAFSAISDLYSRMLKIASIIREQKPSITIVFGDIHTTSVPELVIKEKCIDYICIGEGIEAFPELIDALENNKPTDCIKNIWSKKDGEIIKTPIRPLFQDVAKLPLPDKELFLKKYPLNTRANYILFSAFGCPFQCTFCGNSVFRKIYNKNHIRRRTIDSIITELLIAKEKYNPQIITFVDDIFTLDVEWLKEFCKVYKEKINMPFVCQIHTHFITKEIIDILEDARCCYAMLGIQSIIPEIRKDILKRHETNEEIIEAINLFKNRNIMLYITLIYDIPTETEENLVETALFFNKHRPSIIVTYKLRYYPGLEITDKAHQLGILSDEDIERINTAKDEYKPFDLLKPDKKGNLLAFIFLSNCIAPKILEFILKNKIYKYRIPFTLIGIIHFINGRILEIIRTIISKKFKYDYVRIFKRKMKTFTAFFQHTAPNCINFLTKKRKIK